MSTAPAERSRGAAAARLLIDLGAALTRQKPGRAGALLERALDERRHPLTPAAIRVERSRAQGEHGLAQQTALTVWFGEGPSLPVPGGGPSMRTVVGTVAGIAGVVALGALGVIASQRETRQLASPAPVARITQ